MWHRQPTQETQFKRTPEDTELSCVLRFENGMIAGYLCLTSVPQLADFPCVCLLFIFFFFFRFLDPVLDFILLSVSKFYLLKQFSCGKRTLLSFQVLTRNFPLYENNIFQELEHVRIFEVFPRKGEKRTCDKMSLPCQTALPKT